MNQIISFKPFLIEKVLSGTKDLTTRIETDYRLKLNIGDTIYIYTGIRTKNAKKHAEAIITNRWLWNQSNVYDYYKNNIIIIKELYFREFAKREGFDSERDCVDYFRQPDYIDKDLITYEFKLKKTLEDWIK